MVGVLEGTLRVFQYGYNPRFFLQGVGSDPAVITENHTFFWTFFPKTLSRSPQPIQFESKQPKDRVRIFWFGESAAMGDPEPAFGPARLLEVLLSARFPETRFEVINLAVTAINSHVILPIAREAAAHDADFWCVYMGNNEVHGQFGPGTVFGSTRSSLPLIRASLMAKRSRIGQLANTLVNRVGGSSTGPDNWSGMAMFTERQVPANDPRLSSVYHNFQSNLQGIIDAGVGTGANVLVSSVAVNLRDSAPFRSSSRPQAPDPSILAEINRLIAAGEDQAAFTQAESASKKHPNHAELSFKIAQCHWNLGDFEKAKDAYRRARDLDTLRFRTDGRLNRAIKEIASGHASDQVHFVDAESLFDFNAPNGIPGDEFFWDHVHFRFPGSYLLALAFARELESPLVKRTSTSKETLPPWPSLSACAQTLNLTRWSDYQMTLQMRQRLNEEPFRSQSVHTARDQRLNRELQQHAAGVTAESFPIQRPSFEQALARRPQDPILRDQYARFLHSFKDTDAAVTQWQTVLKQMPRHLMAHIGIGQALAENPDRAQEAETSLRQANEIRPATVDILVGLGKAEFTQKKYPAARKSLASALQLRPSSVDALLWASRTENALGEIQEAQTLLERAAELAPKNAAIATELAILKQQSQP